VQPDNGNRKQLLEEPGTWQDSLARALTPQALVMPVVSVYQECPWAAVVDQRAISHPETVFDNRYFMASSKLNSLNTLLLEEE
jgi:hypothetical protein